MGCEVWTTPQGCSSVRLSPGALALAKDSHEGFMEKTGQSCPASGGGGSSLPMDTKSEDAQVLYII